MYENFNKSKNILEHDFYKNSVEFFFYLILECIGVIGGFFGNIENIVKSYTPLRVNLKTFYAQLIKKIEFSHCFKLPNPLKTSYKV
jgi:hypothetical protein